MSSPSTPRKQPSWAARLNMQELLPLVTQHLPSRQPDIKLNLCTKRSKVPPGNDFLQSYFWAKFSDYLPPRSIVIAEVGTISTGSVNLILPDDSLLISPIVWGTKGYGFPAALGAALADRSRQAFSFVGDGAFQISAQELAPMLRLGVCPTIILFNNGGYLIEKLIHDHGYVYNDMQPWKYDDSLTILEQRMILL